VKRMNKSWCAWKSGPCEIVAERDELLLRVKELEEQIQVGRAVGAALFEAEIKPPEAYEMLARRLRELEKDNNQLIRELDNGLSRKERRVKELEEELETAREALGRIRDKCTAHFDTRLHDEDDVPATNCELEIYAIARQALDKIGGGE